MVPLGYAQYLTQNGLGAKLKPEGQPSMTSAYAVWLGHPVVLQLAAGDLRVPLRGTIVGESDDAVRFRIGQTWDVDIYKAMILAVEEDDWASILT